jgi:hypothetical protein
MHKKAIWSISLKVIEQRKADLNTLLARSVETDFKSRRKYSNKSQYQSCQRSDIDTKNYQVLMAMKNAEVAQQTKREAFSQYLT